MEIPLISKRQFNRFRKFLPDPGNAEKIDGRTVLSCVIWLIKNGRAWKEIPEKYGNFDTIRRRFARWSASGAFRKFFYSIAAKAPKKSKAMLDSTTVKAHRTAASMACDSKPREIGRSVGGLTTKIHLLATTDKIPLDFSLTGGQAGDAPEGEKLVMDNSSNFKYLLADKAYDTDRIRNHLGKQCKIACIPPKSNRKSPPSYDRELYRQRSIIENMFGRLKDWRGIAMRYCRCSHIFDSFICIALISIFSDVR